MDSRSKMYSWIIKGLVVIMLGCMFFPVVSNSVKFMGVKMEASMTPFNIISTQANMSVGGDSEMVKLDGFVIAQLPALVLLLCIIALAVLSILLDKVFDKAKIALFIMGVAILALGAAILMEFTIKIQGTRLNPTINFFILCIVAVATAVMGFLFFRNEKA